MFVTLWGIVLASPGRPWDELSVAGTQGFRLRARDAPVRAVRVIDMPAVPPPHPSVRGNVVHEITRGVGPSPPGHDVDHLTVDQFTPVVADGLLAHRLGLEAGHQPAQSIHREISCRFCRCLTVFHHHGTENPIQAGSTVRNGHQVTPVLLDRVCELWSPPLHHGELFVAHWWASVRTKLPLWTTGSGSCFTGNLPAVANIDCRNRVMVGNSWLGDARTLRGRGIQFGPPITDGDGGLLYVYGRAYVVRTPFRSLTERKVWPTPRSAYADPSTSTV